MRTFTDEEKTEIENKTNYMTLKEKLLKEYKKYAEDLEYAIDDFEEGLIKSKREKLASDIKQLSHKLREIESLENLA